MIEEPPDNGLQELVDELVEAHMDTIEMLVTARLDDDWGSHVRYLQGLVRLAHTAQAVDAV
jgi:HPt (histidine-containing phosphotransfer) domain-containing protein